MKWRVVSAAALVSAGLCLSACRTPPGPKTTPGALVQPAAPPGALVPGTHYTVDAQRSQVLVLVYRDGAMAHLGHNHVISVRQLSGSVSMGSDPGHSSFQIDFPVDAMSVDEAALRAAEGADFQSTVDEAAIAGTRDHMLGEALLNSKQFPQIHLASEQIHDSGGSLSALTTIVVRNTTAHVQIPVTLQTSGDDLTVNGEFDLTHTQLGLTAYSVALGALRVAERIHIRYRLIAHRQP
ncbi:MAG TPA: YceI family protein [Steroidobacteraceae bacterium]|jgi:polyisoprenoid-binding protein YceI|nr:YceI family protein [Steroidobacteraceae bacterium]